MSLRNRVYNILTKVNRRNLAKDIAVASGLGVVGDFACQLGPEGRSMPALKEWRWRNSGEEPHDESKFDPRRLAAITAFSGVYIGCFLHFLYQCYPVAVLFLARKVPIPTGLRARVVKETTLVHSLSCAVVDNVHSMFIYIPAYFLAVGVLQGDSFKESRTNLVTEYVPTYVTCTFFWVPYMWANFTFMPAHKRVQAMAVGNLAWNVIIDYLAHRGAAEESVDKSDVAADGS